MVEKVVRTNTYVVSLEGPESTPLILDSREAAKSEGLEDRSYWATYRGRWLIVRSEKTLAAWDLAKPLTAEGAKPLTGIEGPVVGQSFVGDRWHLVVGEDRRVYFVDVNSDAVPHATEFFRLEPSERLSYRTGTAQNRFFILDLAARLAHVWDISQFENFSEQDVEAR